VVDIGDAPSYALVTPARNELRNLQRLARCVLDQTAQPREWMIVDDQSSDGTGEFAADLAREHEWIHAMPAPCDPSREGPLVAGRRSGRDIVAFHAGLRALPCDRAFVVKLDADCSFASTYFEHLLARFEEDPSLGIASGTCYEHDGHAWRPWYVTEGHVRGATRVWRLACLRSVLPLEERLGWDGVDELKAATLGWRTRSFLDLRFYHHRPFAAREGARWRAWATTGETAHFLGTRPSYIFLRALNHARRERAAFGLVWGYAAAAARREPQCADSRVRAYLRRQQRARNLPLRIREALGRSRV
jgi:biofilm PGA synthesis N-glycosyltransferase PgaC